MKAMGAVERDDVRAFERVQTNRTFVVGVLLETK